MRTMRWVALGLLALALLAAVALLVSSRTLYHDYRPSALGIDETSLANGPRSTLIWLDRELAAGVALLLLSVLSALASLVVLITRRRAAWVAALVASVLAAGGAIASLATRTAVQWDQLALWAVVVGEDVKGYEAAAAGDMVRFVVVDGREVSPLDFRLLLGVHMWGAALAVAVLVVALVIVAVWGGDQPVWRRTKAASSSTASTASGNAG